MLYRIVRPFATIAFKIYFKKIYYFGEENIPVDKPLLVVSNHPTAFFEPCLLACVFPQVEFYYVTRADVFKSRYKKMLEGLHMAPIYRFRDGYASLKNNQTALAYWYKLLNEGKKILVFPESTTTTQRRMKPMQKGTARIAFGSLETNEELDLHILPIGFSYSAPHEFRSEVMIRVGRALPLRDYRALSAVNQNKAVVRLTEDIGNSIRPLMVYVESPADDPLADQIFTLYRNSFSDKIFPLFKKNKRRLLAEQEIANRINSMEADQKKDFCLKVDAYFNDLSARDVDDLGVAQPWNSSTGALAALMVGYIPFTVGRFAHYLPYWYARRIQMTRIKQLEFKGPIFLGVGLIGMIAWYLLLIFLAVLVNRWFGYALLIALPFFGFYSLIYAEALHKYKAASALKKVSDEQIDQWTAQRAGLLEIFLPSLPEN